MFTSVSVTVEPAAAPSTCPRTVDVVCAYAGVATVSAAAMAITEMPDASWPLFEVVFTLLPSPSSGNVTGYTDALAIWLLGAE